MGRVRNAILEVLKEGDFSVKEITERIRSITDLKVSKPQVYQELYLLEAKGKVEKKRWEGRWIWGLK
ncbi:MAG: hypothetical protein ACTSVW_00480 [Candidatus Njordarchaeales archaeon]